jgi:hypothetical protein
MEAGPRGLASSQPNFRQFTISRLLVLVAPSMPRHLTRPQGEKGMMLPQTMLSQWDLSRPLRPRTTLNPYLAAVRRPDYWATSM